MVAIVHQSNSLRNALHYNENKVKQKVAQLIHSGNYPKDTELLGFTDKINRLERQAILNQNTKVNSVHISLNFDAADQLDNEKLQRIAEVYMQKIGFGEQPYLVYRHHDAGHEHIHIVTTNIKADGKRIELHNLARNQSMKASLEIEKEFQLVQALGKQRLGYELKPVHVQKVQYGRSETKRAITNVLDHVLPHYKYTSMAELNAVLKQYNMVADTGSKGSRIYQHKGLVYRILNEKGEKVGIPVKASLIYNKPGLPFIESKFAANEFARQKYKQRVRNAVDLSLMKQPGQSLPELMKALQKEQIQLVLRQNDQGIIYGVTYVDHQTKSVFNGSDLGKSYSANVLQQRCQPESDSIQQQKQVQQMIRQQPGIIQPEKATGPTGLTMPKVPSLQNIVEDLIQSENDNSSLVDELREEQRRRKRKRLHQ
jgi:hypothetical protein